MHKEAALKRDPLLLFTGRVWFSADVSHRKTNSEGRHGEYDQSLHRKLLMSFWLTVEAPRLVQHGYRPRLPHGYGYVRSANQTVHNADTSLA